MARSRKVAVLGDGGWGTAAAMVLCEAGARVAMWGHDPEYLRRMHEARENELFLPGIALPERLTFEALLPRATRDAELVLVAIPTVFLRPSLAGHAGAIPQGVGVVSLTKGIEQETLERPTEIIAKLLGTSHVAVLSGPSHAEEVARGCPTTVVVSSGDHELARLAQDAMMTPSFRVYTSHER